MKIPFQISPPPLTAPTRYEMKIKYTDVKVTSAEQITD